VITGALMISPAVVTTVPPGRPACAVPYGHVFTA
jgi:hypothetical protein